MINQLAKLTTEADGRYASDRELQFLTDYLQSVEVRVSAYAKIRDRSEEILEQTKTKLDIAKPKMFARGEKDLSSIWRRDVTIILRCTVAAMLVNDLDWLRDSLLLWHRTIVNANQTKHISQATYSMMPEVMKEFLTDEEIKLILPILQLNQTILSS